METNESTEATEKAKRTQEVMKIFEKMWKEVANHHVNQLGGYPPWDECARTYFPRRYEQLKLMDDRLNIIQHTASTQEIESAALKYATARKGFIDLIVAKFKELGVEKLKPVKN